MEFSGKGRKGVVTLHPNLTVTGKGYGTALYQHIADIYNINVEESFGEIGKSEAAKKLWNKIANTISKDPDTPLRQLTPSNSSKVVDENGEPLVVYHGSNNDNLTIFKNNLETPLGIRRNSYNAIYFANNANFAEKVARARHNVNPTIYSVFLNIKNPKFGDQRDINGLSNEFDGVIETDSFFLQKKKIKTKEIELPKKELTKGI